MKKWIAALCCALLLAVPFAGCAGAAQSADGGRLQIVATIWPEYEWLRAILGERADNVELTLLLDKGVDMHSYQPTVDDLVRVSSCDLLVCVGGSSDVWVEYAVREAKNPDIAVVRLLEALGDDVREEAHLEGMAEERGHHHDEDGGEHEHDAELDEHVWLSLRFAARLCDTLADALARLDPDYAEVYQANAAAYVERLDALDAAYTDTVSSAARDTLLFADRYPFRYLADDYGLTVYAAFPGCSAETGASFETVAFLAGKMDELSLPCALILEGSDGRLAGTVIQSTKAQDQRILTLDSMQSETLSDDEDYLSVMNRNLTVLREALN